MPPAHPLVHDPHLRVNWTGIAKILGLILLTVLCYAPSLNGGFLWDDDLLISHDPLVQSLGGLRRIWFSTEPYDYFPLTYTSFWLEWPLWSTDPTGYRAVNLLLHLLSAFLFWRLLVRLRVPGGWFGALLFAVHPVNVASVAWIAERKNTLSMVFYLTTILCWVESEDAPPGDPKRTRWYLLAVAAFALAVLSKSSVVMLPFVLLLLAWWRRGIVGWGDVRRAAPFFGVSFAAGLLTVWFQLHRSINPDWPRTVAPPLVHALIAGRSMAFYLGKTVWPVRLSMIYPRWEMSAGTLTAWVPLLAVAALFFAAWRVRARWGRGPLAALGSFALMVLPVSGLVPMSFSMYSFVSDHLVYIPLLGLLAGAAAALARWSERGPGAHVVMAAMIVLLAAASLRRADEFSSSRRLWESTLAINPDSAIAHNNFGLAMEDQDHLPEAELHFRRALALDPALPAALTNIAEVLQREGRWQEAAGAYATALGRFPDAKDYNNYGVVLMRLGEVDAARAQFLSAARMEPAMLSPHFNLYKAARARGDAPGAMAALRDCLRIDPDNVPSLIALAAMQIQAGPPSAGAETVVLAERACQLTGGLDPLALGTLSRSYLAVGRRGEAIAAGGQAQAAAVRLHQPEVAAGIGRYLEGLRDAPP